VSIVAQDCQKTAKSRSICSSPLLQLFTKLVLIRRFFTFPALQWTRRPQLPVYPGAPVNKLSIAGPMVGIPSASQLGVGSSVMAPVTGIDTALPVLPALTTSVVAGSVAAVSAGAAVKAAGGVSLHSGASAVECFVRASSAEECRVSGGPLQPDCRCENQRTDWNSTQVLANMGGSCRLEPIRVESKREISD